MSNHKETCALCSEPVLISGFTLTTREGIKHFCCEGCLCIYQLLHPNELLTNQHEEKK